MTNADADKASLLTVRGFAANSYLNPLQLGSGVRRTTGSYDLTYSMKALVAASVAFLLLATRIASGQRGATGAGVENIFVVRSVRLSRTAPTDYCSERRTALPPATFEDQYDFKAVATRSADGAVVNATATTVGHLHACFARSSDSVVVWFAQGDLNGVQLTGRGDCRTDGREFPEPGISTWRCFLNLTGLTGGFAGGLLTTNTIQSRTLVGMESDPPGYTQPSIATVRLWRAR